MSAPPPLKFKLHKADRPRKRLRPEVVEVAPAAPGSASAQDAEWDEQDQGNEKLNKVVQDIEEHLLKLFRQERAPVIRQERTAAFRVVLLRDYFVIEGLGLALPYSADNQRFLQRLEAGRLPWDQLRAIPELSKQCEGHYVNGALRVVVEDRRMPEHGAEVRFGAHERTLCAAMDDEAFLMDLKDMEMDALLEGRDCSRAFKLQLEALLLGVLSPAPCLHPSLAVGLVCNKLQYDRLKLSHASLRSLSAEYVPLPVQKARFGPASYGLWTGSQVMQGGGTAGAYGSAHGGPLGAASPAGGGGSYIVDVGGKRIRKPKIPGALPSGVSQLKRDEEEQRLALGAGGGAQHVAANAPGGGRGNGGGKGGRGSGAEGSRGGGGGPPPAEGSGLADGEGGGGQLDNSGQARPSPQQTFHLLKRLAEDSQQVQAKLQYELPRGAAVFNKLADEVLRRQPMLRPNALPLPRASLMPEDLLPRHPLPLPEDQLPHTLAVDVEKGPQPRGGSGGAGSGNGSGGSGSVSHELRLGPSDVTGRYQLRLTIVEQPAGPETECSPDEPAPTAFTFHAHDASFAHSLMAQWKRVHTQEQASQRARERKASQLHHQQQAACTASGAPPAQQRSSSTAAYAAAVAASAAAASAAGGGGSGVSRAPPAGAQGALPQPRLQPSAPPPLQQQPLPPTTQLQRNGSGGAGALLPRPIDRPDSFGALMPDMDDFPSPGGGLASPMGLNHASSGVVGGHLPLARGRSPLNQQ